MEKMSKTMQIFAITHLPQIAQKGDAHFKYLNILQLMIRNLNLNCCLAKRVIEIAQMLSGTVVSVLKSLETLLN
jgi:DNA repair protein RecN (Recombination protein N)